MPNFIESIYKIDDITKWKINLKIKIMEKYPKMINFLLLKISDPKFREKIYPKSYLSTECESLKRSIRSKYRSMIDNYFYDIIIHIGDNQEHNREIIKVVQKYKDIFEENIEDLFISTCLR